MLTYGPRTNGYLSNGASGSVPHYRQVEIRLVRKSSENAPLGVATWHVCPGPPPPGMLVSVRHLHRTGGIVVETLYTIGEVAQALRVTERTIINWIDRGKLPAIRIYGTLRIRKSDFDALLEKSSTK